MKKIILSAFIILGLVGTFQVLGSMVVLDKLNSTTYIEANQSFVLGEGSHGSYTAEIINKGKVSVEVFSESKDEEIKSLGVLKPKDTNEYKVAKNTKVTVRNLGETTATIGISLSGETSLSMGYKPNKQ